MAAGIEKIRTRHENGETITALAKEYGISRQALSRYLNQKPTETEMVCQTIRQWAKLNQRFQAVNVMDYNMRIDLKAGNIDDLIAELEEAYQLEDAVRKEEIYTIEDIYALPDGERAELIDGQIYYMAPPSTKHQRLVHFF